MGKLRQTLTVPNPQARVEREKNVSPFLLMISSSPFLHSLRPGPGNGDTIFRVGPPTNEYRQSLIDMSLSKSDAENRSWKLSSWVVWSCVRLTKKLTITGEKPTFSLRSRFYYS